jgi:hypothetical protein
VHRISAVSLVALKSENLSMAGTGSYYILCIEYTLHYTVTSLVLPQISILIVDTVMDWSTEPCPSYGGFP